MADENEKPVRVPQQGKREVPVKVQLRHAHGFIDENGRHRFWKGGEIVADPTEIELLMDRKAPIDLVD